jgi:chromosome segregation ATPase
MPPLARRRAVAKSEMEEQMNMVEVLSEELGAKELKIMKLEEETKKLEEENKELKENLMKCEVNWLYYWSDEEMGEEAYYHPDWWQEELDNYEPDLEEDGIDWKSYYPELYPQSPRHTVSCTKRHGMDNHCNCPKS